MSRAPVSGSEPTVRVTVGVPVSMRAEIEAVEVPESRRLHKRSSFSDKVRWVLELGLDALRELRR